MNNYKLSAIEIKRFKEAELQFSRYNYIIAGIDECDVCNYCLNTTYCAVRLDYNKKYSSLIRDSKQLNSVQLREAFQELMDKRALDIGLGFALVNDYDSLGSKAACDKGRKEAVLNLKIKPTFILSDMYNVDIKVPQIAIPRADERFLAVSAASIIAKVFRNKMCEIVDIDYPEYKLKSNHGTYGKYMENLIIEHGFIKGMMRESWCKRFRSQCKTSLRTALYTFNENTYIEKTKQYFKEIL